MDQQEELSFADIVDVISWIRELCGLPQALAEGKKMCGLCVGQDLDNQPSSSYSLPMSDASFDILSDAWRPFLLFID